MTHPAALSPTSRLIWKAALILSLIGWALIAVRLALLVFGNRTHQFDRQSLIMSVSVLILTTALSLRASRRA